MTGCTHPADSLGRNEWINGLSNPVGESYHPKTTGHPNGYYPVVRKTTG
jgi:hypothetical protein